MADLSEVEDALVLVVASALYPDGPTEPSVVSADCRVYRGWPMQSALNGDLAAGVANVTIFASSRPGKVMSPLPIVYQTGAGLPLFSALVSGMSVEFSGQPAAGHGAGLIVDGVPYVHRPSKGESSGMVAAALADMIRVDRVAQLSGATVTVPGAHKITARIVADQITAREVRRQERELVIACWCSTPSQRDIVSKTIDTALAAVPFIPMPDGSSARLLYSDTSEYDQAQNAMLYRRDLVYSAEYPTVTTHHDPAMLFGDLLMGSLHTFT